ncbi:magnesium transporter [Oceanicella actignis]|uniref:Magnesium transporter MgtE n=1 Tax=Oceanicella actignis TaxID=1189325 RepID=A0A1M7TPF0_9RHOB|nr:magnesium transporter [Oceanicella actignis]SET73472.1 magnesium transporter [Oceanicella actignis]SHN72546.1 magnesium transporter [Oceanicella actignis]
MAADDAQDHEGASAFELDADLVQAVREALEQGARERVLELVEPLHEADLADLLEQLDADERAMLVRVLGRDLDPYALTELEEGVRDEVLEAMAPEDLAAAVKELDADDVVYLVEDLDEDEKARVLQALDPVERVAVEKSLTYPEDTAGRLARHEIVTAPPFWTVGQMIDAMREAEELPDDFHDVVLIDPKVEPVGLVPLSRIMAAPRATRLEDIKREEMHVLRADTSVEDVAYAFQKYRMLTAPVVDADGRLVGVIEFEDAAELIDDEAEEDLKLLAGVGDEELSDSVFETAKARFPWLFVNLLTAILASIVIAQFDRVIEQIVALAVLMPIVASMGGNAGTQTLTVAVRALATRDLTPANAWRIIRREALVGLANGLAFAVIVSGVGLIWYGDPTLGLVLAAAMVINLVAAALAGILIPIGLDKLGADPALASGTFVTTVTDVVGFFAFLGLAGALML